MIADGFPELRESVTITLMDVTTVGLQVPQQAAAIDKHLSRALFTILPNGSPYGVIGWHLDSQFTLTQEPQSKRFIQKNPFFAGFKCKDIVKFQIERVKILSKDSNMYFFILFQFCELYV